MFSRLAGAAYPSVSLEMFLAHMPPAKLAHVLRQIPTHMAKSQSFTQAITNTLFSTIYNPYRLASTSCDESIFVFISINTPPFLAISMVTTKRVNPIMKNFVEDMLRGEIDHPYVRDAKSYKNATLNEGYLTPDAQEHINKKRDAMMDYE